MIFFYGALGVRALRAGRIRIRGKEEIILNIFYEFGAIADTEFAELVGIRPHLINGLAKSGIELPPLPKDSDYSSRGLVIDDFLIHFWWKSLVPGADRKGDPLLDQERNSGRQGGAEENERQEEEWGRRRVDVSS